MNNLKLFTRFNPKSLDVSMVIKNGDDLSVMIESVKLASEISGFAGITISSCKSAAEYNQLCAKLSAALIERGKQQCSPEWVYRQMLTTFIGFKAVENTNILTGQKTVTKELRLIDDLSAEESERFIESVRNWGISKKLLDK